MANFYARYPASTAASGTVSTVQGEGTAGTPVGGVLTVQGDPAGTPIPVTASNPSIGATGAPVPADATYVGMTVAGNLTGLSGSASGLNTVVNAPLPVGTNSIGNIGTVSTVTAVTTVSAVTAITNALPAGTNILGKVAIDQSTPGVTNAVQLTSGSAIIGNVSIDQTTPGTTNAVQVSSGTTSTWQAEGSLAFGSITNAYQTVFTPAAGTKILYMRNNTNASISVSMDAGTTLNFVLDSGDFFSTDLVANGLQCTTSAIQIKYTTGAPTSGSFRVNGVS